MLMIDKLLSVQVENKQKKKKTLKKQRILIDLLFSIPIKSQYLSISMPWHFDYFAYVTRYVL